MSKVEASIALVAVILFWFGFTLGYWAHKMPEAGIDAMQPGFSMIYDHCVQHTANIDSDGYRMYYACVTGGRFQNE